MLCYNNGILYLPERTIKPRHKFVTVWNGHQRRIRICKLCKYSLKSVKSWPISIIDKSLFTYSARLTLLLDNGCQLSQLRANQWGFCKLWALLRNAWSYQRMGCIFKNGQRPTFYTFLPFRVPPAEPQHSWDEQVTSVVILWESNAQCVNQIFGVNLTRPYPRFALRDHLPEGIFHRTTESFTHIRLASSFPPPAFG